MKNVAIVEDDDDAAERLASYLSRYGQEEGEEFRISRFADAIMLLTNYSANYDVIFMDIELPDLNGMDASRKLRELDAEVVLIFVTNMAQFAVGGYEVDAFDFIVKPVAYQNFKIKMRRAVERISRRGDLRLCIKDSDGVHNVGASEIEYIEVINHLLMYHTKTGDIAAYGKLDDLELKLRDVGFFRCNRCYLINMKHVSTVKDGYVVINGKNLQISRPRRKEFLIAFANFFGGG